MLRWLSDPLQTMSQSIQEPDDDETGSDRFDHRNQRPMAPGSKGTSAARMKETWNGALTPCSSSMSTRLRELVTHVLQSTGIVVRTAANDLEMLIAAFRWPGVIVMDVTMPEPNGIEATQLTKVNKATREARVIAYTRDRSIGDSPVRALFVAVLRKRRLGNSSSSPFSAPLVCRRAQMRPAPSGRRSILTLHTVQRAPAFVNRNLPMHPTETPPLNIPLTLLTFDNENLASRSRARVLISAVASGEPEACARRVHGLSVRRRLPFVGAEAGDFPVEAQLLRDTYSHLLDDAAGGTIYINSIEAMPPRVQDVFVELLGELESTRDATAAVRLVSGTTVSLLDCIAAGTLPSGGFTG
jgi:CheY-like chemotaxis protein